MLFKGVTVDDIPIRCILTAWGYHTGAMVNQCIINNGKTVFELYLQTPHVNCVITYTIDIFPNKIKQSIFLGVFVCVCERERERERDALFLTFFFSPSLSPHLPPKAEELIKNSCLFHTVTNMEW